jgi:hypothetical protein
MRYGTWRASPVGERQRGARFGPAVRIGGRFRLSFDTCRTSVRLPSADGPGVWNSSPTRWAIASEAHLFRLESGAGVPILESWLGVSRRVFPRSSSKAPSVPHRGKQSPSSALFRGIGELCPTRRAGPSPNRRACCTATALGRRDAWRERRSRARRPEPKPCKKPEAATYRRPEAASSASTPQHAVTQPAVTRKPEARSRKPHARPARPSPPPARTRHPRLPGRAAFSMQPSILGCLTRRG